MESSEITKEKEKYLDNTSKAKIDLDTILVNEIGQFGKYQLKNVLLTVVVAIFTAFTNEYIFTAARINTRCLISECEIQDQTSEFRPSWILNAVPGTSEDSFDACRRFGNTSQVHAARASPRDLCPATLFDRDILLSCEEYVYEDTNTIVYDYELACDEWRRSLVGSVRVAGVLVALPLTGLVSDRWGRRTALVLTTCSAALIGVSRVAADTYVGFVISSFLEAVFGSSFTCGYILLMELVGPKYRVAVGASMNSFFAVGQMIMGLIAWAVSYWRHLTLILYIPQFLVISYFWILSESVRWYMSQGRYVKSEKVLKDVAKINGKALSERSLKLLKQTIEEEKRNALLKKEIKEPWIIVQVFQHKPILIRCLVTPVWWISFTLIYYGLSINAVNLSGNRYLNYVAVAAVEIPGYWTAVMLIDRIGRKPLIVTAFWICAACQIAYIFLPEGYFGVAMSLYLVGKYCIAAVLTSVYVYTAELYPTQYRHRLFAFSSMIGRVGSITAPLLPALAATVWEQLPFALFGAFALVSGVLVLAMPETRGSKFPDTMEEAAQIGKNTKT